MGRESTNINPGNHSLLTKAKKVQSIHLVASALATFGRLAVAIAAIVSIFCVRFAASRFLLVKDNAVFGVSQSKFSSLLGPIRTASAGGYSTRGNEVGKLLAEGVPHQRALAGLQVGGIHVLGRLVKALHGPWKIDGPALPPGDRQNLAVATADPDLPKLDGLVSPASVGRGVFLSRPKDLDLVPKKGLVGGELHVVHGYHQQGWEVMCSPVGIAIHESIGRFADG